MHADPKKEDLDHLRMLSIFHFVFGGFSLLGFGFLLLHRWMMTAVFTNPQWMKGSGGAPPPEVFAILESMYWVVGTLLTAQVVLTVLSGCFLWQRKHRMFSLVVAGLNCLNLPLGTVLGVFTLVVVLREGVQHACENPYPPSGAHARECA